MAKMFLRRIWLPTSIVSIAIVSLGIRAIAQNFSVPNALPILSSKCFQCHGDTMQMSNLDLRSREGVLKGGSKGPAIVPGNAEASLLFKKVSGIDKPAMP